MFDTGEKCGAETNMAKLLASHDALDAANTCLDTHGLYFFPAEDGIRGATVTGVQTCALPIWLLTEPVPVDWMEATSENFMAPGGRPLAVLERRSEERRVGKECRSRWSAC